MSETDVDRSRDVRLGLVLLSGVLYVAALADTAFTIYLMTTASSARTHSNARTLIFLAIADVVLTVGIALAIKSIRATVSRLSWRLLGWTAIAFAAGLGLLILEAATATRY